ncbi:MAG: 30S ribosomal protein S3 [Candidatus Jacksonbacteria bacterium RIFOXYC2_FULL_44_29]|nr:MAG: 30S ribosomal protein S3 [Parcubacteria group bacterium GW2011_GWA2_42_28]KKT56212.1 MAG: 30S ribosomal protein S3 [Parcubacteria group bacterium GW2011_GWC2_44_22]OGY76138.1 MAG: 30S ribosomal protein S3 [Candidatus Jacksonbacteria bacterium RIFOXYA2_FULL_43_12]OGY77728.1 MAG: 30S ribosomal protein S3 [Candidatus Jacksonbacteria bacterium RIFOXYB2_FULL_44_15]OGY78865.1 MAG: 30S ribosomal protein S3 [Candidatus Jacksonbacteria bacterium RIFOXYD2_FULL_43_21]OGY80204.1 MAG: 30S ribosomal
MGKKVNPIILRISNIKNSAITWNSRWIVRGGANFAKYLQEDERIRRLVKANVGDVGLDKISIERSGKNVVEVIIKVAKPGVIIGRGGEKSDKLKKQLIKVIDREHKLKLTIKEIPKPNLCSEVLAQEARRLIEKRMPFRKVMKNIVALAKKDGADGVKITVAGRLNGAEIARDEKASTGQMPLQNLRANIDYARLAAHTKWGAIGIKVWVYKGQVFDKDETAV